MNKIKWACPKCGAGANRHGKGGKGTCRDRGKCSGFLCECDVDERNHGTRGKSCALASCYHCGWGGEFPVPLFDPKTLTGWAKQAHAAGWTPPIGWTPAAKAKR